MEISGIVSSQSKNILLTYTLRLIDENSKIYINSSDTASLKHILDNLADILSIKNLADRIIGSRKKRYTAITDLLKVLNKEEYERVKPYITVNAYEEKVGKPVSLYKRGVNELYPKLRIEDGELEMRGSKFGGQGSELIAYSQLIPGEDRLDERVPVNINLADKVVLQALVTGLQGFYVDKESRIDMKKHIPKVVVGEPYYPKPFPLGVIRLTNPITSEQAGRIAEEIIKRREKKFFMSWGEFHWFCDELAKNGIVDKYQANVLEANFNPNTDINYTNPNEILYSIHFLFGKKKVAKKKGS